ncbi:MAG: hypothetical protein LBJ25_00180, partial [Candidatus Margulisbacteria bacterium]|nr:hypothetical protein [Candidatus Margulisiibacteriota bacterium]
MQTKQIATQIKEIFARNELYSETLFRYFDRNIREQEKIDLAIKNTPIIASFSDGKGGLNIIRWVTNKRMKNARVAIDDAFLSAADKYGKTISAIKLSIGTNLDNLDTILRKIFPDLSNEIISVIAM